MKTQQALKTYLVLMALSLFWPQLSNGQGSLIFNGGFDVDASGWILTNGASFVGNAKGNPGGWVDLDSLSPSSATDPTISQFATGLIPGQRYNISGDYGKTIDRSNGAITGVSFGVALDGVYLFEANAPADFLWHRFSFSYTPASSSALLSLSSQRNGTEVSYGIDNITMQIVPEPSVLTLLASGGLFLLARWWRQRKS